MRLLVTGAAGFIGSNFVYYWLEKHPLDKITVLDALTYAGNLENLRPIIKNIKFVKADINDRPKLKEALKGQDVVVHFAAESHVDRSIFDPSTYWKTNVHGTLVLLEESLKAGVPRFHHISTDEVYGELPFESDAKFSETTPYAPRPDNLYALSKAEADKVVSKFQAETGMFITISNCSNNYGPYQFPEKFIPIVVTNLIDGIKVPLHGDGRNVRDWIHARDHSSAIEKILESGKNGETYLIGTNNDRSNGFIAEKVVELYGAKSSVIHHVPDRHSNDRRYAIDATKIITELGWKPDITRDHFDDGLKETINWYKKNQDWWRPLLKRKAAISDSTKTVSAFISLDRETGKTKFKLGKVLNKSTKAKDESDIKDHFVEQNLIRYEIVMKNLESKKWYQNSSAEIKKEIEMLGINPVTFGYVEDLSSREDRQNGDTVIKLMKIEHAEPEYGIYGIASWFEVENGGSVKRVEGYYSWGWGPKSGAKFAVFVKKGNKFSHVVLHRESKFATGGIEYTLAGGFPKLNEGVLDFVVRAISSDLGFNVQKGDIAIDQIISLGRINSDAGMTNNKPNLYAVAVRLIAPKYKNIKSDEKVENEKGVVIWPLSQISDLISKCDDSYFLAALTRISSSGLAGFKLN